MHKQTQQPFEGDKPTIGVLARSKGQKQANKANASRCNRSIDRNKSAAHLPNNNNQQLAKENMLQTHNATTNAERNKQHIGKLKVQKEQKLPNGIIHYCALTALVLLSCGHRSQALAYSSRLTNCYEINISYSIRLNGTAPTQYLPMQNGSGSSLTPMLRSGARQPQMPPPPLMSPAIPTPPLADGEGQSGALGEHSPSGATLPTATLPDWKCGCWNTTSQDEVECCCEGEALTRVPQTLTVSVQRLTIASAGLPRLRNTGLTVYAATLTDVVLTDLKELESIQDGAFASLRLLRTIYISHAPKLLYLSKDVFQGIADTIKIIRIINSGLVSIPDLVHLPPKNILQMIDLDNNHITRIEKNSIKIKTAQLILANNEINYIDDSAFNGSQIAKLSLKENRDLREVHPNAFAGISIRELDLSSTSLVRLPSAGLRDIEELRIENTHTLKTIPSIYNFKNLQRAYLTHSFHCCAFKYPSRHDPRRHAERLKEIEIRQQKCSKTPQVAQNNGDAGAPSTKRSRRASTPDIKSDSQALKPNTIFSQSNEVQLNLGMKHPLHNGGTFYSRWERANLAENSDINETEQKRDNYNNDDDGQGWGAEDGDDDDDDMKSDSNEDIIGHFHNVPITLNTEETQVDEYCGNFTLKNRAVECYPAPDALNPCEDVMGYQWLRISVWIVVTLAVVGNVAVLVVILSIRTDTSVPRFLMCHLAFADLCLGLYLLLIASIDAHSMGEYFNFAYDWQYGAGCKVAGFLTVFASHLSVFTLTIITIERWLAITHALLLDKRLKLRSAAYIMAGGWIYAIFMSAMPLFGISNYSSTSICLPMEIGDLYDTVYLVSILGLNGTAFCIIAICYARIYFSLGQETRHAHNAHPGEMSVAKKMALLVFTNFACCAPIAFFGLTALAGFPLINVTKSKILLVFFYPLNSCADPYLYAILTAQYRQDLFTLLSKFGMCKDNALKYNHGASFNTPPRRSSASVARKSLIGKTPETQFMLHKNENFV